MADVVLTPEQHRLYGAELERLAAPIAARGGPALRKYHAWAFLPEPDKTIVIRVARGVVTGARIGTVELGPVVVANKRLQALMASPHYQNGLTITFLHVNIEVGDVVKLRAYRSDGSLLEDLSYDDW
jgi:hypothetical protein